MCRTSNVRFFSFIYSFFFQRLISESSLETLALTLQVLKLLCAMLLQISRKLHNKPTKYHETPPAVLELLPLIRGIHLSEISALDWLIAYVKDAISVLRVSPGLLLCKLFLCFVPWYYIRLRFLSWF